MHIQTSNGQTCILVIEPLGVGGELLLKSVRSLGYRSVVATTEEVYKTTLVKHSDFIDEVVFTDFADRSLAIQTLVQKGQDVGASGIVVAWEFLTDIAAEVAHGLKLCGPDVSLAKARRNKFIMHRTLDNAECPVPALQAVLTRGCGCSEIPYEELQYPLVVKPAENAASFGVSVVNSFEEFPLAVREAGQWSHEYPHGIPFSQEILVQEYIPGQEFSVEAVTVSGRFIPWGVTMKFTTSGKARAETAHMFPAPIPSELRDKILKAAEKATHALGVTNGISHTEIKLDKVGEPRIIESCSRPAGDYIPHLVELSTGENPLEIYVKQSAGKLDPSFSPAEPYRYTAIQFLRPDSEGIVRQVDMPTDLQNAEVIETSVTVTKNTYVTPGSTNIERLGWAILAAATSSEIIAAMDEFNNGIKVCIE